MTPNQYDYVLSMFTSDDKYRPHLKVIFPNEDYYCATDSHSLCVVPKQLVAGIYKEQEKTPNVLKLFNKPLNREETISKTDFLKQLASVEWCWMYKYEDCKDCEGTGIVECRCCGSENDCRDCEGTGKSNDVVPFSKMELDGEYITFLDKGFTPQNLNKVFLSACILDVENIVCKWNDTDSYSPMIFEIKDCRILVMPNVKS